jgi:hypothetical protein
MFECISIMSFGLFGIGFIGRVCKFTPKKVAVGCSFSSCDDGVDAAFGDTAGCDDTQPDGGLLAPAERARRARRVSALCVRRVRASV